MIVQAIQSTHVVTVPPQTAVTEALRLMGEHGVRHLPVVEDGRLLGMLADRDLLEAIGKASEGAPANGLQGLYRTDLPTLSPEDSTVTAAMEMMSEKVGCLAVTDSAGGLVGVLSETDLIRAYAAEVASGDPAGVGQPRVSEHMSSNPMTLAPTDTLGQALEAARQRGFRHFPVLDSDGELIGVVSDRDLFRELSSSSSLELPVEGAMTREVLTTDPQASLPEVANLILEQRISCVPVLKNDRLVGMLTTADLVDHCLGTLGQG